MPIEGCPIPRTSREVLMKEMALNNVGNALIRERARLGNRDDS